VRLEDMKARTRDEERDFVFWTHSGREELQGAGLTTGKSFFKMVLVGQTNTGDAASLKEYEASAYQEMLASLTWPETKPDSRKRPLTEDRGGQNLPDRSCSVDRKQGGARVVTKTHPSHLRRA